MVTTTIQEQIIREAPEIEAIKLGLLQDAKGLAGIPLTLPPQQVAGLSGLQQQAFTGAEQEGGIGGYQPFLGTGQATLGTGLGTLGTAFAPVSQAQTAAQGMQGLFAPSDLSPYTNPFQQQVIDETMAELNRQGQLQQNQLAANAVGAGAFGGSRFGVQEAELGRNLQDVRARALAQLNQQNYAQALQSAQQAFEAQQTRTGQASQLLSGIGQLTGQLGTQQAGIGGQQLARVAFLSDIYKGAPSTQTTLGSQIAPSPQQPSTFQQIAGLGTGLLGTAAAANQLGGIF
jgi:hypothetical protein